MNPSTNKNDFLLMNVPLLRPAWPVPTFSRILPLMRTNGYQGDWWDENIKFFRYFYSEEKFFQAHHLIQKKISLSKNANDISNYKRALQIPVDDLVAGLRDISNHETFADLQAYKKTFQRVFIDGARLLSYAYDVIFDYNQLIYRSPLSGKGYNFAQVFDVIELIQGSAKNICLEFFANSTLPRVTEFSPKIVGISISSAFELVPAFTLARVVKEYFGDNVHIVMGGNFLSRVEHRFRNSESNKKSYDIFWSWMDSYVYSKCDLSLLKLIDCILNDKDLKSVPNLVFRAGNKIVENEFSYGLGIDELPQSDFGTVLDQKHLYFVPPEFLTIPIYTSIGCSYSKCSFCAIDKMSGNYHACLDVKKRNGIKYLEGKDGKKYRFYRKIEKIIKEMVDIKNKYGLSYFSFNDETFDIDFALKFSEEVSNKNHKIYWQAFARAENKLTSSECCRKLYQGGCRLLRIGFEYLSQDKLNQTQKGYSLKKQRQIAEALNQAGIWIHAYFMVGNEEDFINAKTFFQEKPEFYDLFHTLEFFSQVNDRHSLETIHALKKGTTDGVELDMNFPQFRVWHDLYPRARKLVKELRTFAQDNFPIYSYLYEPSEVAYFPVINCMHGLDNVKKMARVAEIENIN